MTELEVAIRAQPGELRRLAGLDLPPSTKRLAAGERIWVVGTGTSWHAAELGAAMFERAGVDARFASSNEFALSAPLRAGDGVIVLSHTGKTAYARAARQRALDLNAPTVSITGAGVGWPEGIETGEQERSETYTRSYTSALAVLALIAGELGAEGLGPEAVVAAADAVEETLESPGGFPQPARLTVLAGLGPFAVTAREGALKLREAARLPAEGYDAEYLLHGSAVPLTGDDRLLTLAPPDSDGFVEAVAVAAERSGVAVSRLAEPAALPSVLAQIPLTVRLQLLALRIAQERGTDPDTVITGAWADERLWSLGSPS